MNTREQVYEQAHIDNKVCVYNGVYEGNIPVSMIRLYTRGSGLIFGERPVEFIQSYVNKYLQGRLGLIPTWRPMVFLGRFKEKPSFLLFEVKKQIDRGMYNKGVCTMKYLISCKRNGTYTYVEAHVLFYKTWLIIL